MGRYIQGVGGMSQSTKEANDSGNKTEASSKKRDYFFLVAVLVKNNC